MKKSEIMQIIREEVQVVLTNEEAIEMFDLDPAALLDEMMTVSTDDLCLAEIALTHSDDPPSYRDEDKEDIEEAWKGDPEIKQTGDYADKTKKELCDTKKKLMDKKSRTKPQQTKVRQINFAIRSKQKGPKFGKVGC